MDTNREIEFFRSMQTLDLAIHHAALAINDNGKRYSHQCRLSRTPLLHAKEVLIQFSNHFSKFDSFHLLHLWLTETLRTIRGLGELYIYDTAFRLGAFLRLAPKFVYLHRGTRAGAKALGLKSTVGYLTVEELPKSLHSLVPHEIEDFLCIYKKRFTE